MLLAAGCYIEIDIVVRRAHEYGLHQLVRKNMIMSLAFVSLNSFGLRGH